MDLDELLGIESKDPLQRRARAMVQADETFLDELVGLRRKKGLSQEDVAARLEVSQSAVARIESGERDPRLSTLRRYAMAIGAVYEHQVIDDEAPDVRAYGAHKANRQWEQSRGRIVIPVDENADVDGLDHV